MRRSLLPALTLGALFALSGCQNPARRIVSQISPPPPRPQPASVTRVEPVAPAPEAIPETEVSFYDLTGAYGLKVSIDMVTGRRVCRDEVNEVIVMPSTRSLIINREEHPLPGTIRWRNGVLYLPGEARAILAEHLRLVPIQDVASDPELFDGSDPTLSEWMPHAAATTRPASSPKIPATATTTLPAGWQGDGKRPWRYIVIHHSATPVGSADSFHREHSKKWPNGLGYHFVIGNGHGMGDGEIEVGPRWERMTQGIDGAHAGNERYNKFGIGICLVGDFNEGGRPTARQLVALRQLCRALMGKFGISKARVLPHRDVRKGHTDCPGNDFPLREFVRSL